VSTPLTTKKYFGTDGIRGRVGDDPIHPEFVLKLGYAIGKVFTESGAGGDSKVLIGKDTRISGYMFESALEAGLSAAGVDIHLTGPMPTPAIAYLTRTLRAKAGIVISASHNRYQDNGFKFFSEEGSKLPDHLEAAIEQQLAKPMKMVDSANLGKAIRMVDAAGRYIEFCKSTIATDINLRGLKIVVDCANGATYHIAPSVFQELGAEVIELNVAPDGLNINEQCGSIYPQALQKVVVAEQADVGIAFDGDGDRVIMVDHKGEVVDGDELLFIIAADLNQRAQLLGGVIGTVMSNLGLELAFKSLGIEFVRTKVGDRYIMEELCRMNWLLGGEASGHIIWLGATTTGDGIVGALQVLAAQRRSGRSLNELKSIIQKFPQSMVNVTLRNGIDPLTQPSLQKAIRDAEMQLNGRGRVLLRSSGTEPVLRVMVEGEDHNLVSDLAKYLAGVVEQAMVPI
jgi:phosphoglucosamine mutase